MPDIGADPRESGPVNGRSIAARTLRPKDIRGRVPRIMHIELETKTAPHQVKKRVIGCPSERHFDPAGDRALGIRRDTGSGGIVRVLMPAEVLVLDCGLTPTQKTTNPP